MTRYSHPVTRSTRDSLYRAQNRSIVAALVWLIALTAVALGALVIAAQLGVF